MWRKFMPLSTLPPDLALDPADGLLQGPREQGIRLLDPHRKLKLVVGVEYHGPPSCDGA
jgi:hypothetical protein